MKDTGVSYAYAETGANVPTPLGPGFDNKELVPEGNRVRLFSIVWLPMANRTPFRDGATVQFTNGETGDVLYKIGYGFPVTGEWSMAMGSFPQTMIPGNGIVFSNGIWAQALDLSGSSPVFQESYGMMSVGITFQGIPSQSNIP